MLKYLEPFTEISQHTELSTGNLKRLAVHQTSEKRQPANEGVKNSPGVYYYYYYYYY